MKRASSLAALLLAACVMLSACAKTASTGAMPERSEARIAETPTLSESPASEQMEATPSPSESPLPSETALSSVEEPSSPSVREIVETQRTQEEYAAVCESAKLEPREIYADNGNYEEVTDRPPSGTYKLVIDVNNQAGLVYERDESGAYTKLVRTMICTTGRRGHSTPGGTFKMGTHYVRFGFFKKYDCYAQYWSQIVRNIYVHSLLYSRRSAKSLISSSYRALGSAASHGCVRMAVPDARWVYENMAPGSVVTILSAKTNKALREAVRLPKL